MLSEAVKADTVPQGVGEVLTDLVLAMIANPIAAIVDGRYIGILFWAVILGLALIRTILYVNGEKRSCPIKILQLLFLSGWKHRDFRKDLRDML